MKYTAVLAAAAAALAATACSTVPDPHPLTGTRWQLVAIETSGSTTTLTPATTARHTIAFRDASSVDVQLDCNRGRATWTAEQPRGGSGAISFGPIPSTRMACPEPSFGTALAQGLGAAERFTTSPDGRELTLDTPQVRLTFIPAR
jgi:heat shock protein HslJ